MRVSANFTTFLASAAMLAILAVGAPAIAQELQGLQAQTGPRLDFPAGLATDGRAVYVANSRNNTVEAIDVASKSLRIVAGKLFQQGSNDGTGDSARFNSPDGMTIVGQNLYLCDTNNSDIRQINVGGRSHHRCRARRISPAAKTAPARRRTSTCPRRSRPTAPRSTSPTAATARSGASRSPTSRSRRSADKRAPRARPRAARTSRCSTGPRGVAVDKKAIYVADTGNDVIRKIDLNTLETSTLAGTGEEGDKDGPAAQAQFNNPGALCTDGTILYVLDADNHAIRKIDLNANTVTKLTLVNGHIGSGCALTSDGKQLYFSDTTENAVEVVDTTSGNFTTLYPPGQ